MEPNEQQLSNAYDVMDRVAPMREMGYNPGVGHDFTASQHKRILEANGMDPGVPFESNTAGLERATLKLRLSLDASELLNKNAEVYVEQAKAVADGGDYELTQVYADAQARLTAQQQMAMEQPDKAAAVALVEANAHPGTPQETKTAAAFADWQLGTLANELKDKKWVFSTDSYLADFAAMAINPVRTIVSQGSVGGLLGEGKLGYFRILEQWHGLSQAEKEIMWEPLFAKLKEAAGGNELVLASLASPLIYEEDKNNAYIDTVFDLIDTGSTVAALALGLKLRKNLSYAGRAIRVGNGEQAGKAVVEGIKAGDPAAITHGHPLTNPLLADTQDLSKPTQLEMTADLIKSGRLQEGEDVVARAQVFAPNEIAALASERKAAVVAKGGTIISDEVGPMGVEITFSIERPNTYTVVTDLKRGSAELDSEIKRLEASRKLLILDGAPGAYAPAVADLTKDIDLLRAAKKEVDAGISANLAQVSIPDTSTSRVVEKKYFQFTQDDLGQLNLKDKHIGSYSHILGTPETRIGKLIEGFTSLGTNMRQQQRRLFGYFDKPLKRLRKEFNAGMEEDLNALLLTGDRLQKVFTPDELRSGVKVDGLGLVTFPEKMIQGYQKVRKAFNDLYLLTDRMVADELTFGGYEEFSAKLIGKDGVPYKSTNVYGKTDEIKFEKPSISKAMDLRTGSVTRGAPVKLSTVGDLADGLTNKRYGFVKLKNPIEQGDGAKYTYGLVDVDDFGAHSKAKGARKIESVLDYRVGYVPSMAKERIVWLVETPKRSVIDGVEVDDSTILRGFETESEAAIYVDRLKAKNPDSKAYKVEANTDWRRQPANKEKSEFLDNRLFRGAFTGFRHDNATFRVGLDGAPVERVSSFDALQRYADYVSAYAPMNEFKQATISQFLKAAKNENGVPMLEIASRWDSKLSGSGEDYTKMKAMQDWMKSVFAVPSTEEQMLARVTDRLLNTLERAIYDVPAGVQRKGTDTLKGLHHWISTSRTASDPVTFLKSLTFDLMLGSFNPVQYFIQSAGMAIPATLHPLQTAMALPEFTFLRTAMHMPDYKAAARAGSAVGLNGKKMETMLHALHRSGIPDSILENADFGHYAGTHGAYYSPSMFNRIRDKSRMFYNAGELNNRLMSFTVAFNRLSKEKGWDLTKKLNDAQINEVVKEALRLGTNMTAGNKAKWQDGWLGMPTQFWQQTHKYYENLFYGLANNPTGRKLGIVKENQWTQAESLTALATNLIGWGAAGYGVDEFFDDFDRYLLGKDGLDLDPEKDKDAIAILRGGFMEVLSLHATGNVVDISDRTGPANGLFLLYEKIYKPIIKDGLEGNLASGLGKVMFGASGAIMTRAFEAGKEFVTTMVADSRNMEWDEGTLLAALRAAFSPTSTATNIERALAWKAANDVLNTKGLPLNIVEDGQEIPFSIVALKAVGLDPLAKEKMEKLLRADTMNETEKASLVRSLMSDYRQFFSNPAEAVLLGEAERKQLTRVIAMRKDALAEQYGTVVAGEIMVRVMDELNKEFTQYGWTDFQQKYFEALVYGRVPTDRENAVEADLKLAQDRIKGKTKDAD